MQAFYNLSKEHFIPFLQIKILTLHKHIVIKTKQGQLSNKKLQKFIAFQKTLELHLGTIE